MRVFVCDSKYLAIDQFGEKNNRVEVLPQNYCVKRKMRYYLRYYLPIALFCHHPKRNALPLLLHSFIQKTTTTDTLWSILFTSYSTTFWISELYDDNGIEN